MNLWGLGDLNARKTAIVSISKRSRSVSTNKISTHVKKGGVSNRSPTLRCRNITSHHKRRVVYSRIKQIHLLQLRPFLINSNLQLTLLQYLYLYQVFSLLTLLSFVLLNLLGIISNSFQSYISLLYFLKSYNF